MDVIKLMHIIKYPAGTCLHKKASKNIVGIIVKSVLFFSLIEQKKTIIPKTLKINEWKSTRTTPASGYIIVAEDRPYNKLSKLENFRYLKKRKIEHENKQLNIDA